MINALNALSDVASGSGGLDVVDSSLRAPAKAGCYELPSLAGMRL